MRTFNFESLIINEKTNLESLTCVGKTEVQIADSMYIVFIAKFTCINRVELNCNQG